MLKHFKSSGHPKASQQACLVENIQQAIQKQANNAVNPGATPQAPRPLSLIDSLKDTKLKPQPKVSNQLIVTSRGEISSPAHGLLLQNLCTLLRKRNEPVKICSLLQDQKSEDPLLLSIRQQVKLAKISNAPGLGKKGTVRKEFYQHHPEIFHCWNEGSDTFVKLRLKELLKQPAKSAGSVNAVPEGIPTSPCSSRVESPASETDHEDSGSSLSPKEKSIVSRMRIALQAVKASDPDALKNSVTFSELTQLLERHSGLSRKAVIYQATLGMGLQSPADVFRFHCADLVTVGPVSAMPKEDLESDSAQTKVTTSVCRSAHSSSDGVFPGAGGVAQDLWHSSERDPWAGQGQEGLLAVCRRISETSGPTSCARVTGNDDPWHAAAGDPWEKSLPQANAVADSQSEVGGSDEYIENPWFDIQVYEDSRKKETEPAACALLGICSDDPWHANAGDPWQKNVPRADVIQDSEARKEPTARSFLGNSNDDPWHASAGDPWQNNVSQGCPEVHKDSVRKDTKTSLANSHDDPWHSAAGDPWQMNSGQTTTAALARPKQCWTDPPDVASAELRPTGSSVPSCTWEKVFQRNDEESEAQALFDWLPTICQEQLRLAVNSTSVPLRSLVLDVGARARAYFGKKWNFISEDHVTDCNLKSMMDGLVSYGGTSKFYGIQGTLHKVAALHGPGGRVTGFTIHVNRAVIDAAHAVWDLFEQKRSILVVGPARSGKTALLRDVARRQSLEEHGNVMVADVDGSIGGMEIASHRSLGFARRVMWPHGSPPAIDFLETLIREHLPETLIIDEPRTWFGQETARALESCGPSDSVRLVCSMRGTLNDALAILDGPGGMQIFDAAISLEGGEGKRCQVIRNLPEAIQSIREAKSTSAFQSGVQALVMKYAESGFPHWSEILSPRLPLGSHPLSMHTYFSK